MTSLLCDVFQCNALRTVKFAIGGSPVDSVEFAIWDIKQREKASAQKIQQVKLDSFVNIDRNVVRSASTADVFHTVAFSVMQSLTLQSSVLV